MSSQGRDRNVQLTALILSCANTTLKHLKKKKSQVFNYKFTQEKGSCPGIIFGCTLNKNQEEFISCFKLYKLLFVKGSNIFKLSLVIKKGSLGKSARPHSTPV